MDNDRPHFHFLVSAIDEDPINLDPREIREFWGYGISEAEYYQPEKGAAFYMLRGHPGFDVALACPRTGRCKRRNCVYTNAPWPSAFSFFGG